MPWLRCTTATTLGPLYPHAPFDHCQRGLSRFWIALASWTTTTSTSWTGRLPMWYVLTSECLSTYSETRNCLVIHLTSRSQLHTKANWGQAAVKLATTTSGRNTLAVTQCWHNGQVIDASVLSLQIAVALGNEVHLYNSETGKPSALCTLPGADIVTSVNWSADGKHLAVGTSDAKVCTQTLQTYCGMCQCMQ